MPNTFTPDGDEFNQIWQPIITSGIAPLNFELLIFNRWGQIIWESHDISAGWDGTYDNKSCSEGVYFYMAECTDVKTAKKFLIQGHLTLLR